MIPDLRFIIGAVIATALLGVAAFGFGAAIHIVHQTKVGPLQASRMLAYTPNDVGSERAGGALDDPFAKLPASPGGMRPQADIPAVRADHDTATEPAPVLAQAADAPTETAAPAPGDPDTVDERAVIDPPLPSDDDPAVAESPAAESPPLQAAETLPVTELASPATEPAPPARASPIETAPAAPAPVAEMPVEPTSGVDQVGSVPTAPVDPAVAEPAATPPAITAARPQARKAAPKAKPAARKAIAKAKPRTRSSAVQPVASTGYPLTGASNGFYFAPAATKRGTPPAKGLWPGGE